MLRFKVITLLCSLGVLQASSTIDLIDKCLSEVSFKQGVDYWSLMPTVIRRYMLDFLPEKEAIKLHEVSKGFNDVGNGRNCQDVMIRNKGGYVTEQIRGRLNQADAKAILWLIDHHPSLKYSFLFYSARNSLGWGMTLSELFPSSFTHYIYTYPERSARWASLLDKDSFLAIHTTCLQYNKGGLKAWMCYICTKELPLSLPILFSCMQKKAWLEGWEIDILGRSLAFRIDKTPRDIMALRGFFIKFYREGRLYSYFVERRGVPVRNLSYMCTRMAKVDGELLKDILFYWFREYNTDEAVALEHELTEDLCKLNKSKSPYTPYVVQVLGMLSVLSSITVKHFCY